MVIKCAGSGVFNDRDHDDGVVERRCIDASEEAFGNDSNAI
jgi:hypothetical protein